MDELNLTGKTLAQYNVGAEIGGGSLAVVYRGFQPSLGRQVAIKVLRPALARDSSLVERFLRQAQAAASLRHPNIVVIYDVGQQEDVCYFVMEYLEGQTLRQILQREGPLAPARVASLVDQVARALDYAHQRGFVHQALDPGDIFVGADGHVTLTDLGMAGLGVDRVGALPGTPEYMAPEQARGGVSSAASDQYTLGVIAYQMLTGQVPFSGETSDAVLYQHVHEPAPPLPAWRRDLPSALNGVLARALERDPARRYPSTTAFAQALAAAVQEGEPRREALPPTPPPATPPPAWPPEPPRRRGVPAWLWIAIGLLAIAVVALGIVLARGLRAPVDTEATAQALVARLATETAQAWTLTQQAPTPSAPPSATETPSAPASATPQPSTETATATPSPTPTSTGTSTPTASATATATSSATPTPTRTPTRTPTPTPPCALAPDPQLAPAWDRSRLGCPMANAAIIWAAWEPFQHGYMWWRSDNDWAYVFNWQSGTDPAKGNWATGGDPWKWDGSFENGRGLTPPEGLYEPIRGFGYVWFNFLGGPNSALGWATDTEKGFCANVQKFEKGVLFHSSTVQFCEDELFNWATQPSFTPLFFELNQNGTWKRY